VNNIVQQFPWKRVYVVGTSGSGKSTFAKELAQRLGYPHTEIDSVYHQPNWTPLPREVFRERMETITNAEAWVIDGNYSAVQDIVLAKADLILWLNYPLSTVMYRVTKRTVRRFFVKEELWNGNKESLKTFFHRENIIVWALTTHNKNRRKYSQLLKDPKLNIVELVSPKAATEFLARLKQ